MSTLLESVQEWISGDWGNEEFSVETPNPVYCIRGADIVPVSETDYSGIPQRYVSERTKNNKILKAGDIVVEKSGGSPTQSTGRTVYISKELVASKCGNVVCSNFCEAFRVKDRWDSLYVYYYLQLAYNSGVFFNFEGKTSGLKNLDVKGAFKSIKIPDISVIDQKRVACVIAKVESKIALNRKKIEKLEALAKTIYDYWFVQFDFPDANGRPYKSSGGKMVYNPILKREIPEGWEVGSILSVSDLRVGGTPSKMNPSYWNGEIPFWGPTDYADGIFQFQTTEKISDAGFENCSSDMLSEDSIIITARGSIGKVAMVGVSMAMNQSCFAFEAHENNPGFVYFLAKQLVAHLKATSTGSVFNAFVASDLRNVVLSLGNSKLRNAYTDFSRPMFKSIKNAAMEIRHLASLRDFLLPLLMNGQVEVGE